MSVTSYTKWRASIDTRFFILVLQVTQAKNAQKLAGIIKITPSTISRIRNGRKPITADLILRIYEAAKGRVSIEELMDAAGIETFLVENEYESRPSGQDGGAVSA